MDRKQIKDRLLGRKADKTEQEMALDYLQSLGKKVKKIMSSLVVKKKVFSLSP